MTELIIIKTENSERIKSFLEKEKVKYRTYPQPRKSAKQEEQEEEKKLAKAYEEWANDPDEWKNGGEDW